MSDLILTARDLKNAGYCARGVRNWMKSRDMDFEDFVRNGATETDLRATVGDAIADRVVAIKNGV